jgi:hypothetical protein
MGPRAWAAIGNYLRIGAAFSYIGAAILGYLAIDASQHGASGSVVQRYSIVAVISFVSAVLLWNAKGPLVSGNLIVRLIIGVWMLLGVITSLGLLLIVLGIIYLFTGEPDSSETFGRVKAPKQRFKAPANWRATGHIGPSGATVYSDAVGGHPVGIFDSFTPVQVTDRRAGLAHVVAATGESGWIDTRVLSEAT